MASSFLNNYRRLLERMPVPLSDVELSQPSEAQKRVFRIYELLLEIFSYCDKRTVGGCSTVCREWSEPALDVLWRSLDHPSCLVHILKFSGGDEYFSPPNTKSWARFNFYAKRVRQLGFQYGSRGYKSWDLSSFTNSFLTRPNSVVLPSLRRLEWDAPDSQWVAASLVFIHPGLQSLHLSLPMHSSPQIAHFISLLFGRVPQLVELHLSHKTKIDPKEIESPMVQLIHTLQCLKRIVIPRTFLTAGVMIALSYLPELIELSGSFPGLSTTEYNMDVMGGIPRIVDKPFPSIPGGFPKLIKFQSAISMTNFGDWLQHPDMPRRLKLLANHDISISQTTFMAQDGSQQELETIARIIHGEYLQLEILDLKLGPHNNTFASIRPLLILERLRDIRVTCEGSVDLTDNNIHELVQSMPFLRRISFPRSPDVRYDRPSTRLSLAAIDTIVTHCRNIREIELFIDAKKIPTFIPTSSPSLRTLILGTSYFHHSDAVDLALWFSHLSEDRHVRISKDISSMDKPFGVLFDGGGRAPDSYPPGMLEVLPTLSWNDVGKMSAGMLKSRVRGRQDLQTVSPPLSASTSSSSKGKGKAKEVALPERPPTRINCGCNPESIPDFDGRRRPINSTAPEGNASPCLLTVDLPKPHPYNGEIYYHPGAMLAPSPPPLPHHIVHPFMGHPVMIEPPHHHHHHHMGPGAPWGMGGHHFDHDDEEIGSPHESDEEGDEW